MKLRTSSATDKIAELESKIAEIDSKIGDKPEKSPEDPTASGSLTERQMLRNEFYGHLYAARTNDEPMLADLKNRLLAEAKQRVAEVKRNADESRARLQERRLSSERLSSAINCNPNIVSFDTELEQLAWSIDTEAEKIRSAKEGVSQVERAIDAHEKSMLRRSARIGELYDAIAGEMAKKDAGPTKSNDAEGWIESETTPAVIKPIRSKEAEAA